jgi:hypothetical protein
MPVYAWDVGRVPAGLRGGPLGSVGRLVAHVATRCAIGTSLMLALSRPFRRGAEA